MLELIEVTKGYGAPGLPGYVPVLQSVYLKLNKGESIAVLGPSGCGKSTLLNITGALDRPSSGRVILNGRDLTTLNEAELAHVRNKEIGFVFQMHHLLPHCTVLENILIPTIAFHEPGKSASYRGRALELMERIGISECMNRLPGELSGGQRQRAAVARALINSPGLLLADEPTGSLDHETAESVMDLLNDLNNSEKITLVVVTHAIDLAGKFGRLCTIQKGILVEEAKHER
ncbi:MAG: ABC transporter ATP-binding protein [Desulfatiglans sp.]|jgi:ABC-type lipoprotein export system ATPase subunit|nr:ABC transporter ATP-binding protein [Desulfatiglans sp.]